MGKNNKVPTAPNYSALMKASQDQLTQANKLQQDQVDWAKTTYADDKTRADKVANSAIALQDTQAKAAQDAQDRYDNVAIPLQDKYIQDANGYDTPARRDLAMGAAQGAVASSFDAARDNATRDLESYGINPSATRYAALDIGTRTAQAAATAAAGTTASLQNEAIGRDMREKAINMTSGLPQQVNADAAGSTNSGGAAVNSGLATTASGASTMGTVPQLGALANSSLGTSVAATGANYDAQMAEYNANFQKDTAWMAPVGAIAGVAAGTLLKKADGGSIPVSASPSRGAIPDDVHTALTPGEFVFPADTVRWLGEKSMHAMIAKAATERAETTRPSGSAIPSR